MSFLKSLLIPLYMIIYRIVILYKNVSIGRGCYIKNVNFLGSATIEDRCRMSGHPSITVGNNFYMNASCHFLGEIEIGDNVMIGPQTIIWGRDHKISKDIPINRQGHISRKIVIGNDVWIGANVTILKDVIIHDGAVIGAGAVVTKSVASYKIAAGVPAMIIGERSSN